MAQSPTRSTKCQEGVVIKAEAVGGHTVGGNGPQEKPAPVHRLGVKVGRPGLARTDSHLALEQAASVVRSYAPGVVPELLQTAGYAHAVAAIARPASTAQIQQQVELLMRRQHLLDRPAPLKLWVAIEEAVLRRPFGGTEVWRDQLGHLTRMARRDNVTVQIVPDHVGGPAISTVPFTIFRFERPDVGDVVHLHHATGTQCLDDRADLDAYHVIWDRLSVHAMPPEYTGELLTALTAQRPATALPSATIQRV